MEYLEQRSGIYFAVAKLHERLHVFSPFVVNFRTPQFVPGFLIVDLRVKKKLKIVREDDDLRDAGFLDFTDEFGPDIVVMFLVLGEGAWLQAQGKRATNRCLPFG